MGIFTEMLLYFIIGDFIVYILFLFLKIKTKNQVSKYNLALNPKIKFMGILAIYTLGGSISLTIHFQGKVDQLPTLQEEVGIIGIIISIFLLIPFLFNCLTSLMSSIDKGI